MAPFMANFHIPQSELPQESAMVPQISDRTGQDAEHGLREFISPGPRAK